MRCVLVPYMHGVQPRLRGSLAARAQAVRALTAEWT